MPSPRIAAASKAAQAAKAASGSGGGWPRYKRMVWTGAFAAITFVGTIYGAGLKTRMEYKEVRSTLLLPAAKEPSLSLQFTDMRKPGNRRRRSSP
jgi:hypothetical protein